MLVSSDPHETRIAVLEEDRLTEIFIERHRHRSIVGNVYKGRVNRVLPGMQAAFVDIGLERDAFLYVSDVERSGGDVEGAIGNGEREPEAETDLDDLERDLDPEAPAAAAVVPSIEELLRPGQEILVQVVKAPLPNKGARITAQITLPGRYLVLLPAVPHIGVSRRIEDEAERERLTILLEELAPPGVGLIVRTVGEGEGRPEFEADLAYLRRRWERLREAAAKVAAPTLVHRDLDLALRVVRDVFGAEFAVLLVEGEETYARIVDFLGEVQPSLLARVKLAGEGSLLDRFGIPAQIEGALKSKVWLKSGGYIVINQTEALVAVDVNTGRYTGRDNLEQTVLETNLEAVTEVVRQLRLRDLGGIIVVDLIDMVEEEHRERVFTALENELRRDRAKHKVLSISEFGLVEITRKRSRASLERLLTRPCPYCAGSGRIKAMTTLCLDLRREVLRRAAAEPAPRSLLVRVNPEVAQALQREEREILDEIESALGQELLIQSDPELHHERFDVLEV